MCPVSNLFFFFNDTATTEIYTLSLHDALPIYPLGEERGERLVDLHEPQVAEDLRVEARVEEGEHGVLDPADVLVHGHPVLGRRPLEHSAPVPRAAVAPEIPRRPAERLHRCPVPAPAA